MRSFVRARAIDASRALMRCAMSISSPTIFLDLVNECLRHPALRHQLVATGFQRLVLTLRDISTEENLPFSERQESYSQEGEDLFLMRFFGDRKKSGFYVDVGALHPFRFSNTYLLYQRGWRGINIDATPGSMEAFRRARTRDINIECMISSDPAPQTYFQFNEPALNTVSPEIAKQREGEGFRILRQSLLHPKPLWRILEENVPAETAIDLLTIDVEGLDLAVLQSNDWSRFRPSVVIVELLETALADVPKSPIHEFLAGKGYRLVSKLFNSAIFAQSDN